MARSFLTDGIQTEISAVPIQAVTGDIDIAASTSFAFSETATAELLVPIASSTSFAFSETATLEAIFAPFYVGFGIPIFYPLSAAFPHNVDLPFPPIPPPPTPSVLSRALLTPASDTIRGGADVVLATDGLLVETFADRTFTGTSMAADWLATMTGSGGVRFSSSGLICDTGLTAGATAGATSLFNYGNYDLCIDVALHFPVGAVGTPVDLAVLEVTSASGASARVRIRRGVGSDPSLTVVAADATLADGEAINGSLLALPRPEEPFTLRIVRNGSRMFGFVGRRDALGRFSELIPVLDFSGFAPDAGVVRFRVANLGYAGRVLTTFSNVTFRSHMTIDSKLITDKFELGTRRMFGKVPATTLARLGFRDTVVFGLFGEFVTVNGFLYILPPPKTAGRLPDEFLRTYQDVQLRDGSN